MKRRVQSWDATKLISAVSPVSIILLAHKDGEKWSADPGKWYVRQSNGGRMQLKDGTAVQDLPVLTRIAPGEKMFNIEKKAGPMLCTHIERRNSSARFAVLNSDRPGEKMFNIVSATVSVPYPLGSNPTYLLWILHFNMPPKLQGQDVATMAIQR
ncbi:hypothetical protein B0H19DRAFT_1064225 [Mycena capillaripes]|nr:hypothetical protein B0H19DRAFT_1064225 [Mycena capillaripes]